MKKFILRYCIVYIIIVIPLVIIRFFITGFLWKNELKISAKDIFNNEIILEKKENIKPNDIGNINKNPAEDYEDVSEEYNWSDKYKKINIKNVKEVQVFFNGGLCETKVYYYSNEINNIKYINNLIVERNEDDEREYENIAFILKNKTVVYKEIYVDNSIKNKIKQSFTRKHITLSETARLGSRYDNIYENLGYTESEHQKIINCLTKIEPIDDDYRGNHGTATIYDVANNLIWAYQFENRKEACYAYRTTDSKELVQILDRLCSKKFKELLDKDISLDCVFIDEFNDKKTNKYNLISSVETIKNYAKNNYNTSNLQNNYYRIWFMTHAEFGYAKFPITDELRKIVEERGELMDEY